jgi:hypothetical protein
MLCERTLAFYKTATRSTRRVWEDKLKIKVKCTLAQALGLCTGRTAHRGSKSRKPFLYHGTRRGSGVSVTSRPLFTPGKTWYPLYCTGGWVGPRTSLERCGKPRPNQDFFLLVYLTHTVYIHIPSNSSMTSRVYLFQMLAV